MKRPTVLIVTKLSAYVDWISQILNVDYDVQWIHPQNLPGFPVRSAANALLFVPGIDQGKYLDHLIDIYKDIPIIMLSQESHPKAVACAFRKGVRDYLIQPKQEEIKELLNTVLEEGRSIVKPQRLSLLDRLDKFLQNFNKRKPETPPYGLSTTLHFNSFPNGAFSDTINNKEAYHLDVKMMGEFEVKVNGQILASYKGRKGQALLSYLLYHNTRSISRDVLMETFWPKVAPSSARNSLNVALHGIRKAFESLVPESDLMIYRQGSYSLNPEWEIRIDVKEFQNSWKQGQSIERTTGIISAIGAYEQAISFYTDAFLQNDPYSDWVQIERDNLQETYLAILERLLDYRIEMEEYAIAQQYGEQALRLDACREHIHRQLMLAHCKCGRRNQAIRQYQRCCSVLKEELNISPSPRTQELFERIRANELC